VTVRRVAVVAICAALLVAAVAASAAHARVLRLNEFQLPQSRMDQLRQDWVNQLMARYPLHSWAPMKFDLSDRDLHLMGLPSKRVLLSHRYRVPTAVYPNGKMVRLTAKGGGHGGGGGSLSSTGNPGLVTYAGAGFFGIRPGAWLLLITKNSIGWCSMAHVYGTSGAYQISTAGHCGKAGDIGTVIGALGNKTVNGVPVPVLIDFGKFSKSTGDAGIGKDWALISIYSQYQSLVSPTMAFWGGPFGIYSATGDVLAANLFARSGPQISINPNPTLVQQIVHYGHGVGVGTGGTPRTGTAITWRPTYYAFFGAITPGDSGSGSNTLTGDHVGAQRQAAGINTHIFVDPSLRTGVGIMAGTRATLVQATLANGQLVPYPVPAPGAP